MAGFLHSGLAGQRQAAKPVPAGIERRPEERLRAPSIEYGLE
jgi:hypothetical protein